MNEEVKITCDNDVMKYSPDQIYDYIYKLQNNWNELKKWLQANDIHYAEAIPFKETLRKMQELEGNNE